MHGHRTQPAQYVQLAQIHHDRAGGRCRRGQGRRLLADKGRRLNVGPHCDRMSETIPTHAPIGKFDELCAGAM
eukprot:11163825-Lingulodinium_polyedra.AAC.1